MLGWQQRILLFATLLVVSEFAIAKPKTQTTFARSLEGFTRVKIENETNRVLACYVAIDGHKIRFKLPPYAHSKWYKSTDTRFTHKNFSTWCDYIEFHPEYE